MNTMNSKWNQGVVLTTALAAALTGAGCGGGGGGSGSGGDGTSGDEAIVTDSGTALTAEAAAAPTAFKFPIPDTSVGGVLTFFTQHDSYHLGQLSMLRKHLVGSAMSYKIG